MDVTFLSIIYFVINMAFVLNCKQKHFINVNVFFIAPSSIFCKMGYYVTHTNKILNYVTYTSHFSSDL